VLGAAQEEVEVAAQDVGGGHVRGHVRDRAHQPGGPTAGGDQGQPHRPLGRGVEPAADQGAPDLVGLGDRPVRGRPQLDGHRPGGGHHLHRHAVGAGHEPGAQRLVPRHDAAEGPGDLGHRVRRVELEEHRDVEAGVVPPVGPLHLPLFALGPGERAPATVAGEVDTYRVRHCSSSPCELPSARPSHFAGCSGNRR
jgi:hypothetical protein